MRENRALHDYDTLSRCAGNHADKQKDLGTGNGPEPAAEMELRSCQAVMEMNFACYGTCANSPDPTMNSSHHSESLGGPLELSSIPG